MTEDLSKKRLLTTEEAAAYLGIAPVTLYQWRYKKLQNVPHVRIGRKVAYRPADLDKWIESRVVNENV